MKPATTYYAVMGKILVELRQKMDLKQVDMAKKMELGQSTWSKIEQGTSTLSMDQLVRAAEILETEPAKIVEHVDEVVKEIENEGIKVEKKTKSVSLLAGLVLIGGVALTGLVVAALAKAVKKG